MTIVEANKYLNINIKDMNKNIVEINKYKKFINFSFSNDYIICLKRSEVYSYLFLISINYHHVLESSRIKVINEKYLMSVFHNISNGILFTNINEEYVILSNEELKNLNFSKYKININNFIDFNTLESSDFLILKRDKLFLSFPNGNYINIPFRIYGRKYIKQLISRLKNRNIKIISKDAGYFQIDYIYVFFDDQEFNNIISEYKNDEHFNIDKYLNINDIINKP